jgi:CheY-like chemotaxis protein
MKHIALICDDHLVVQVLTRHLQAKGFIVTSYVAPEKYVLALGLDHRIHSSPALPDAIVLDLDMPHDEAFVFLRKYVALGTTTVPVIAITDRDDELIVQVATASGVVALVHHAAVNVDEVYNTLATLPASVYVAATPPSTVAKNKNEGGKGQSQSSQPAAALTGATVLWVEDDPFLLTIVKKKFTPTGAQLVTFTEGASALEWLKKNVPQAAVFDVLLPGMDGFELLRAMKAMPQHASVPVIMLSNMPAQNGVEQAKKYGATDFFVKATMSLDAVINTLTQLIQPK